MARIFSISFPHDDDTYSALISVRTTPDYTEYSLTMLDDALSRLLPSNKIISSRTGEYAFLNADTGNETLMNAIIKAVSSYIHSMQA